MSDGTNDHKLERLRTELAAAQQRIVELEHELEGRGAARARAHIESWSPALFLDSPTARFDLDETSSSEEKLTLYRSLFAGRDDVFAMRWHSDRTGKSGWSPAVQGGWDKRRANPEYLTLTDEVLRKHLTGKASIGLYPLLRDDRCRLLACDFDRDGWELDALAYVDACIGASVPAALERSRSGRGGHVWVFFADAVPASSARLLGAWLLRRAMDSRAELDLSSYDRLFPSQDFLPRGNFGNLIALPLQGTIALAATPCFSIPAHSSLGLTSGAFSRACARSRLTR